MISDTDKEIMLETHRKNKDVLKIPRRPKWDATTSACELQTKEKEEFLEWRRNLAMAQETEGFTMTPYEKNLEFWRQLWRVVERSDVVVQIVDARNPLLFRCEDLELYVKEVSQDKMNMILINKADFLTDEQRRIWAKYFDDAGMMVAFFSATLSAEETLEERRLLNEEALSVDEKVEEKESDNDENDDDDDDDGETDDLSDTSDEQWTDVSASIISISEYESADDASIINDESDSSTPKVENDTENNELIKNSPEILNREKLLALFKKIHNGKTNFTEGITTIGLVGYPNVGKSSTINSLLMDKKVSVSATPGKTKHFQTLYVDEELMLCDCPGLVMPSFVCTKAEMVLHGILPIDQLRDHVPSVTLVGSLIPRHIIEDTYGIMFPLPIEGEQPDRPPTAEEILNTYGCTYRKFLLFLNQKIRFNIFIF